MPRLSVELLCRCTGHANKRRKDENQEQFLARVTHLYCSEKNIEYIENLHLCRSLSVLYLYENQINQIERLDHNSLLTHVYLQNNCIQRMENLNHLNRLTKLYLSHNNISVVEGLEGLTQLTELHIAHQNLPVGEKLLFDPRSMKAIANTLIVLNVSGNMLDTLEDLVCLNELQQLLASENDITRMKGLSKVLSRFPKLWKLDLVGNPVTSKHKYRDRVVTMCYQLEMLDGREISEMERQFLFSWKAMRKARQKQMQQINTGQFELLEAPSLPLHVPPTIPPLPARPPIRFHQRRKQQMEKQTNRQDSELHLPPIPEDGRSRVNMTAFHKPSLGLYNNSIINVNPIP